MRVEGEQMVMERDLTWGGEHTIQYTDDVFYNCAPETYIILSINVTLINSIKIKKETFITMFVLKKKLCSFT